MGFYSQKIFPYLLDWSLSDSTFNQYRQEVLAEVEGEVLEIGFGTGLNLSFYPDEIHKIITVDNNPGVNKLAQKRIEKSSITVDHRILSGENLPMADNTFDSVVSTWTLCSIEKVEQAVKEIHRVLKPGGKFFFIEHGLSNEPSIQTWQNRLNPIQNVIADGCNLNRNIRSIVQQQFIRVNVEEFYADKTPKFLGYMYQGVAVKG
ncbi:methylase involved in ubiquinone/menaquinone biosynthesis [Rivularia sp. PCC 7116]|uniref:class I SAM-dependent methyltransferase n=1 Tax=Rivularia sp. PCC 7116 TaxID=373994 RepID=UPI00029F3422|nr:class I SAM-dependent methyltransferase [Rivularia sp. PCC 7116]AFY54767.1 methylase involved in ubiquinone/menaquinone biosynthesis [Rivularia sp. PCC 7116]